MVTEINEASYSRIYQHTQDDSTFAIIGSQEPIKDENGEAVDYVNRKKDLYKYIQAYCRDHAGIGYNEIQGTYTYDDGSRGAEDSLIIYKIPKEDAVEIGKKLGQKSILWKDKDFMGYIYMDGRESDVVFNNIAGKNMNFTNAGNVGYGSKLPKDNNSDYGFAFEGKIKYPGGYKKDPSYEEFVLY